MLLIKTRVAASPIEGVGLFAAEPVPKGTVVWRFEQGLDLVVPEDRVAALPEAARAFFQRYAFPCPFFPGGLLMGFDNTRFVNHSTDPNLDNTGPETIARRDIAEGEELTTDYGELEPGFTLELAAAPAPASGQTVDIFTDGACSGNPGPGGWGALLRYGNIEKELSGGAPETTNNRMELMGAIAGLEALKRPSRVRLHTDSMYLKDGITKWLAGWKKNGWRTADKKPVKNVDLWQRLEAATHIHDIEWLWIRGHSGHPENERVDQLAREEIRKIKKP